MKIQIKFLKYILIIFGGLLGGPTQAWQEVRNGGDALVCLYYDSKTFQHRSSVYLFDFHEMSSRYGLELVPPEWDIYYSLVKVANEFVDRIPNSKAHLKRQAKILILNFLSSSAFTNEMLDNIEDMGQGSYPQHCKLEQLVIQQPRSQTSNSNTYYIINKLIWDQMDEIQQAATILHEVLYRLSPDHRKSFSSEKIRYLVARILSDSLKNEDDATIDTLFAGIGLNK